jgi:phosphosulfolactate synthase (CoM biosynthesis protein A)
VGSKETLSDPGLLIEQARDCLAAGAVLVLVEAAELVEAGRVRAGSLEAIKRSLPLDKVMIELPGPWIPNVRSWNVAITTILDTEAARVGLGTAGPLK